MKSFAIVKNRLTVKTILLFCWRLLRTTNRYYVQNRNFQVVQSCFGISSYSNKETTKWFRCFVYLFVQERIALWNVCDPQWIDCCNFMFVKNMLRFKRLKKLFEIVRHSRTRPRIGFIPSMRKSYLKPIWMSKYSFISAIVRTNKTAKFIIKDRTSQNKQ